jgi:hypothetical protein
MAHAHKSKGSMSPENMDGAKGVAKWISFAFVGAGERKKTSKAMKSISAGHGAAKVVRAARA